MRNVLAAAQSESMKAQDQLALLMRKHDNLKTGVQKGFESVKAGLYPKMTALCDQAMKAETPLDDIRLSKAARAGKCLREKGAASDRSEEDVAFQRTTQAREEREEKTVNISSKIEKIWGHVLVRVVSVCANEVSEL